MPLASTVLICSNPLEPRQPDPDYQIEADAARTAGLDVSLINFEALVNDRDASRAVRRVPAANELTLGIYRGWMLRVERYEALYNALADKGIRLINDPAAYVHCHHLPASYSIIEGSTPRTVWIETGPDVDLDAVHAILAPFGDRPIIIKDYVMSRKHEWTDACFIPSASDRPAVERVVRKFIELQGEELAGGLVFREFVEFERIGTHPKSGMPLTREHRIFWLDGEPVLVANYWSDVEYVGEPPPIDQFRDVATRVRSRFFTMDIARSVSGEWMIVELGDGQVAGLPEEKLGAKFYRILADRLQA